MGCYYTPGVYGGVLLHTWSVWWGVLFVLIPKTAGGWDGSGVVDRVNGSGGSGDGRGSGVE